MNAHTPGPWKTGREDMQSYTGDGEIAFTNIYQGSPPQPIGRAEGDNNKADAKLIAAAPDLAEALRALVYGTGAWTTLIENAVAALAKAGL